MDSNTTATAEITSQDTVTTVTSSTDTIVEEDEGQGQILGQGQGSVAGTDAGSQTSSAPQNQTSADDSFKHPTEPVS